jgi:hypothetical protein
MNRCSYPDCENQARLAIRTTRPHRRELKSVVWYDDRTAPKTASRYCRKHAIHLATELIFSMSHEDAPVADAAVAPGLTR